MLEMVDSNMSLPQSNKARERDREKKLENGYVLWKDWQCILKKMKQHSDCKGNVRDTILI